MTLDIEVYFNLEGESKEVWDCLGDLDGKHVSLAEFRGLLIQYRHNASVIICLAKHLGTGVME